MVIFQFVILNYQRVAFEWNNEPRVQTSPAPVSSWHPHKTAKPRARFRRKREPGTKRFPRFLIGSKLKAPGTTGVCLCSAQCNIHISYIYVYIYRYLYIYICNYVYIYVTICNYILYINHYKSNSRAI